MRKRPAEKFAQKFAHKFGRKFAQFFSVGTVVALVAFAVSTPAWAADLAVLRNGFTIRHDHHKEFGDTTRLFLSVDDSDFTDVPTAEIAGYEKDPSPDPVQTPVAAAQTAKPELRPAEVMHNFTHSAADLTQVVNSASATYHLDPDLVNSVIHAESGFNSHAVSPKGARGLMQLMPSTASSLGVDDAFDPQANVEGGSRYLRELLERYNFDLVKALAAYNAGPGRVEQYQGVPPYRETRGYVARIVRDYNRKKVAQERTAALAQKKTAQKNTKKDEHPQQNARTQKVKTVSGSGRIASVAHKPSAKSAPEVAANSAETAPAR